MRRLPPLNSIRAFEAAARHLSFTRAARELNVTQSAVSHQIKALEARLGVPLFRRLNRALLLTDEGQAYLPAVRDALDRLAEATERLLVGETSGTLTVSVMPSFAARWLVPRLARFRDLHPDIDVRLSASDKLVDFARDDVDVAIRYGRGTYPSLHVTRLLGEDVFPVCSPALRDGDPPLRRLADLARHTLLHDIVDDICPDWPTWLRLMGADGIDTSRGPVFSDSSMLLQAAVDGQGVALGRSALAAADLEAGRLVKPFDVRTPLDVAYYLVCPRSTAERPKIAAFRAWLLAEADAETGRDHRPATTP